MPRKSSSKRESGRSNGLKYTQSRIHCPATTDPNEPYVNEQDQIDIDNFLNTLAEVALAVATRKISARQSEDEE